MTPAKKLHAAFFAHSNAEEVISELLDATCPDRDDFSTDYYDNSIEVYGVTPSAATHDAMKAAGFSIVWQHTHPSPRGNDCTCPASRPKDD